jgi:hypothetical protein
MQHTRFMVLTGHLDDYSLPGLIKMLHGQRKTGRLQIDYAESPAAFYFEEGRLVDARIGTLKGLEAVYLALSLEGASFNFNPLIKPPERTVAEREQRLIQGLLEAPSGGGGTSGAPGIAGREMGVAPLPPASVTPSLLPVAVNSQPALPSPVEERLIAEVGAALASHSKRFGRERAIYATVIGLLLLLTFITRMRNDPAATPATSLDTRSAVATRQTTTEFASSAETSTAREPVPSRPVADASRVREQPLDLPDPNSAKKAARSNKPLKTPDAPTLPGKNESKATRNNPSDAKDRRTVKVLLRIERGRVLDAAVQNHHAGMESFEALALRIARQRQYPKDFTGKDVLRIDVKP